MWQLSSSLVSSSRISSPRANSQRAVFTTEGFTLALNAARPAEGATLTLPSGNRVAAPLWGWRPAEHDPPRLSEAYARGADLVLEFAPHEGFPFHTQVYWQCGAPEDRQPASISLVISVRTHLLDTHPVYEVGSCFQAGEASALRGEASDERAIGALLTSPGATAAPGWCVVETIQSGDLGPGAAAESSITPEGVATRWRLFDQFLEKGVIRRAKLSLALAPAALSQDEARALAERLRTAPAPLST